MNINALEQKLLTLVANPDPAIFLYDLLLAYEQPRASITRLQKGDYNLVGGNSLAHNDVIKG